MKHEGGTKTTEDQQTTYPRKHESMPQIPRPSQNLKIPNLLHTSHNQERREGRNTAFANADMFCSRSASACAAASTLLVLLGKYHTPSAIICSEASWPQRGNAEFLSCTGADRTMITAFDAHSRTRLRAVIPHKFRPMPPARGNHQCLLRCNDPSHDTMQRCERG